MKKSARSRRRSLTLALIQATMLECLKDLLVEGVADKTWPDVADQNPQQLGCDSLDLLELDCTLLNRVGAELPKHAERLRLAEIATYLHEQPGVKHDQG